MKIIYTILHYKGIHYTLNLAKENKDIVIIDAMGDIPNNLPNKVIKIRNEGFTKNWQKIIKYYLQQPDWDFIWLSNNDITIKGNSLLFFNSLQQTVKIYGDKIGILTPSFKTEHEPYSECNPTDINKPVFINKNIEFCSPLLNRKVLESFGNFPNSKTGGGIDMYYSFFVRKLGYELCVDYRCIIDHDRMTSIKTEYYNRAQYLQSHKKSYTQQILPLMINHSIVEIINLYINKRNYTHFLHIGGNDNLKNFISIDNKVRRDFDINLINYIRNTTDRYDIILISINNRYDIIELYKNLVHILKPNTVILFYNILPKNSWHTRSIEHYKKGEEWYGDSYLGFLDCVNKSDYLHYTINEETGIGIIDTKFLKNKTISVPKNFEEWNNTKKEINNYILFTDLKKMTNL